MCEHSPKVGFTFVVFRQEGEPTWPNLPFSPHDGLKGPSPPQKVILRIPEEVCLFWKHHDPPFPHRTSQRNLLLVA